MSVRSIPATPTVPAHLVSATRYGKAVYVNEVFKGSVRPMKAEGFFMVWDTDNHIVRNEDDPDGLWTSEWDALDFVARM